MRYVKRRKREGKFWGMTMVNRYGLTRISKSISLITCLREPSKALTIKAPTIISAPSTTNWLNVFFGIMLSEEPISARTLDRKVSMKVIEICNALLWEAPPIGNSVSLNPR